MVKKITFSFVIMTVNFMPFTDLSSGIVRIFKTFLFIVLFVVCFVVVFFYFVSLNLCICKQSKMTAGELDYASDID